MRAPRNPSGEPARRGRGLTAQEAADYVGVTVRTLAKWRHAGTGPRFSAALGRDPRYHVDDLDAFLWGGGVVASSMEASDHRERRRVSRG